MPFPLLFYQLVVWHIWEEAALHLISGHPLFTPPAPQQTQPEAHKLKNAHATFA